MAPRFGRVPLLGLALVVAFVGGITSGLVTAAPVFARSGAGDVLGGPSADPNAVDCANFLSQADAQAVLDADPSDPYQLDQGGQSGVACETPGDINTGPHVTCRDLQTAATAQALLVAASGDPYGLDPGGDRVACNGAAPGDAATNRGGATGAGSGTRAGRGRGAAGRGGDAGNASADAGTVPASGAAAPPPDPGGAVTPPTGCRIFVQTDRSFAGVDCTDAGVIAGHLPSNVAGLGDLGLHIRSRVQEAIARAKDGAITATGGRATVQANGGTSVETGGGAAANANGGAVATGAVSRGATDPSSSGGRRSAAQGQAGDPTTAQPVHGGKRRHHGSQRQQRHDRP